MLVVRLLIQNAVADHKTGIEAPVDRKDRVLASGKRLGVLRTLSERAVCKARAKEAYVGQANVGDVIYLPRLFVGVPADLNAKAVALITPENVRRRLRQACAACKKQSARKQQTRDPNRPFHAVSSDAPIRQYHSFYILSNRVAKSKLIPEV